MEDLDKILASAEEHQQAQASEETQEQTKQEDLEVQRKQQQLENLNKAIVEANARLKETRSQKPKEEEEEIPQIDFNDPSSKAWAKHIKEQTNPFAQEFEKEKEEIRTFALRTFLADKPALAQNPEKLKKVMETYERIKTASERTTEGVLIDLNRAFAAEYSDELISQVRERRINTAMADAIVADAGVSRGSTAYFKDRGVSPVASLSESDKAILSRWHMEPEEWGEMKKQYPGS